MPSKKKTRRSISVTGLTFARISQHCTDTEQSISGYLERLIAADMAAKGIPPATELLGRRPKQPMTIEIAGHIFTW